MVACIPAMSVRCCAVADAHQRDTGSASTPPSIQVGNAQYGQVQWDGIPYNEVADEAGCRRARYSSLAQQLGWDPLQPPETALSLFARRNFGDGTRLLPIPLVLDRAEHRETIQAGVTQRARALQQFFADVILGEGQFLAAGFGLTESLLDDILVSEGTSLRELRHWWSGQARDRISFVYGPDLVRGPVGRWLVLEDNVGCVSGCADSFLVLDAYLRAFGPRPEVPLRPDLIVAMEVWLGRQQLQVTDRGVVALLTDGDAARWSEGVRQQEDLRRERLVRKVGVKVLSNSELERIADRSEGQLEGVRAIINIGVPSLRTWPMLLSAFFRHPQIPMLNAPGTSVLGNKALLPFVGSMVQFYCAEDPLLDAPPTIVLHDGRLPADPELWVVKAAAGCDGAGVFHLRSQTTDQLRVIANMIAGSWPLRAAIAQRRVEASRLSLVDGGNYVVELRAVGYVVGWQAIFSGQQCLARLSSINVGDEEGPHGPRIAPVVLATASGKP